MTAAIDAVDAGTWPHLAYAVDPGIRTMPASVRAVVARGVVAGCLGRAVSATLLEAGWGRASRWLTSVVVAPDGDVVDVRDVVEAALDTGDTARVRALLEAAITGAAA